MAALCAWPSRSAFAQTPSAGTQSGVVVVSSSDNSPVFGAEVRDRRGVLLGRTDATGRIVLGALASVDSVDVRALGFRPLRLDVGVFAARTASARVALEPLPTTLAAVITTVGQRTMRAAESPTSVRVVDKRELDAAAAVAVNQVLRNLPGLQEIPSPPSQTSIAIRGLDAQRVLVLVDGEPAAGALIDNRDIGRLSTLGVKRVEVTKGPSSVEFGSDALGGVINIVTAPPSDSLTMDAQFRRGELGRLESMAAVSKTLGAFGFRVDGGWRQLDRVTGVNADGTTLERVYDLRADTRTQIGSTRFRVNGQGSRERQRWPIGGGYNGFIDNLSAQALVEAERPLLGGTVRARGFTQAFSYQYRQSRGDVPIAGSADSLEQRERLTRGLLAWTRDAGRHRVDVGAQYASRFIRSPGKVTGAEARDETMEAFARDAVQMGPVLATVGARATHSSLWGDWLNPSVGFAWQAAPQWRVRATSARGFRAPSFKEMRYSFLNASGGYQIDGNANLAPETSWSNAFGVTYAPHANVVFDAEVFDNDLQDLIDTRLQGRGSAGYLVYRNVNVSKATTRGAELSARVIHHGTEASLGYTLLDAKNDETGLALSRRSRHTARATVTHRWWERGLLTDLSARYASKAPAIGENATGEPAIVAWQGAFLSVDGQARMTIARHTTLSVGVNNLLDQRPEMYTPAFARQVYVGLSWQLRP